MRYGAILGFLVLATGVGGTARISAQESAGLPVSHILREASAHGWTVRVATFDSVVSVARVNEVTATEARLVGRRIPLATIARIDRQTRNNPAVLPTAILGGVAFGYFGNALFTGMCENRCSTIDPLGLLLGAGFGFVAGAGMGAALGPHTVSWTSLWKA
jgi:hypothetical protein